MDRNREKGMLWGLVLADAFGSPIQFSGKDSHPRITDMVPCPVFGLPCDRPGIAEERQGRAGGERQHHEIRAELPDRPKGGAPRDPA